MTAAMRTGADAGRGLTARQTSDQRVSGAENLSHGRILVQHTLVLSGVASLDKGVLVCAGYRLSTGAGGTRCNVGEDQQCRKTGVLQKCRLSSEQVLQSPWCCIATSWHFRVWQLALLRPDRSELGKLPTQQHFARPVGQLQLLPPCMIVARSTSRWLERLCLTAQPSTVPFPGSNLLLSLALLLWRTPMELEGVATFASTTPGPSYRYVLTVKNEELSIWMEDPVSKKQWINGNMDQTSYLTPANTVAGASAVDYAMTFHEALSLPLDASSNVQRKLTPQDDGSLLLELTIGFAVLSLVGQVAYAFSLAPGSLERVYVLEEKLREKHDEVEQLKAQLLEKQRDLEHLHELQRKHDDELWQLQKNYISALNKLRQTHN